MRSLCSQWDISATGTLHLVCLSSRLGLQQAEFVAVEHACFCLSFTFLIIVGAPHLNKLYVGLQYKTSRGRSKSIKWRRHRGYFTCSVLHRRKPHRSCSLYALAGSVRSTCRFLCPSQHLPQVPYIGQLCEILQQGTASEGRTEHLPMAISDTSQLPFTRSSNWCRPAWVEA